jgi:hypothetical protein
MNRLPIACVLVSLLMLCICACIILAGALAWRTLSSANHFRSTLPFSAQDVQTASVDFFPDWSYYLKARLPEEDFARYVQDLELGFCGDEAPYWVVWHTLTAPAWWDPTSDISETYCLKQGDIWALAKYENGYVYLHAFSY